MLTLYVGYDEREDDDYDVCVKSAEKHAPTSRLAIVPLYLKDLRAKGFYWRRKNVLNGQAYDVIDGRPFSTDFAFSRFLVPLLHRRAMAESGTQGNTWALFCDSDFLWRADPTLLLQYRDETKAVCCVKQAYNPLETRKMDGRIQEPYPRKNWSSLVLWNTIHPANQSLNAMAVNTRPGRYLHRFEWLADEEIGEISPEWNWLEGTPKPPIEPAAVHFTLGTPRYRPDAEYADEWRSYRGIGRSTDGSGPCS